MSTPKKEAFQRSGGLSSGHVSLRFIKKLAFVFLEREAPLLAEPLMTRNHQQQHVRGVVGNAGMPVLEVILELDQNLRHAPVNENNGGVPLHGGDSVGDGGARRKKDAAQKAVWDVPPRYERLREEQKAHRLAQTRVAIEASRAPWGGGATSMTNPGTTATAVAQSGLAGGSVMRSGPVASSRQMNTSAATFPSDVNPSDLVTLEDQSHLRELHLAMGGAVDISAEELLRQPPHVAAYRLLKLSDCPMPIQEQSRIDDAWLFRTIAEIAQEHQSLSEQSMLSSSAATQHSSPEFYSQVVENAIASVKSRLFLCWCQLFGDGGKTLLFSDAVVMELPHHARPQHGAGSQAQPISLPVSRDVGAATPINNPNESATGDLMTPQRRNLPIHYLQERLRRQQATDGGDDHMSEAQKFLKMVAQRQLLLQLELRDHQLSQTVYPQSYREDRLGLPRPPTLMNSSPGSPSLRRHPDQHDGGGVYATMERPPPRHHIDVGHAADIWSSGLRHRGVPPATEHPKHFPPATSSAAAGRSPTMAFHHDDDDLSDANQVGDGRRGSGAGGGSAPRSFLVGDDDETFCIPKRRVRMGELGRYVDAPAAASSSSISLGAYWQHLASTSSQHGGQEERAVFQAAAGAPQGGHGSPFKAVSSVPSDHRNATRLEVLGAARRQAKKRSTDYQQQQLAAPSPMQAAMTPGAVASYTPGKPWTHRHKAFDVSSSPPRGADDVLPHGAAPSVHGRDAHHYNYYDHPHRMEEEEKEGSEQVAHDDHAAVYAEEHHQRASNNYVGMQNNNSVIEDSVLQGTERERVDDSHFDSVSAQHRRSHHQRIETMFVTTVRELAPIRQATEKLLVDTSVVGQTIEKQLATSAQYREKNRGMLLQAKQLELTLSSIDERLRALQQMVAN
ncbi:Hypothetical protein, putative [Bodo saltans]|uniref:Uncharacterized protein n=1 Tax=Bodo saltans TaxID=75058 RepID=A0A0S4KJ53_BODSA|nr:Hypothetical protein, putative [Bodo saltans]|eukprot:CUI15200.1 Hypothetical protein, putative [Bodo saltans]